MSTIIERALRIKCPEIASITSEYLCKNKEQWKQTFDCVLYEFNKLVFQSEDFEMIRIKETQKKFDYIIKYNSPSRNINDLYHIDRRNREQNYRILQVIETFENIIDFDAIPEIDTSGNLSMEFYEGKMRYKNRN
jgi:hypothetical protein